jgi:branched-chain amino acid transport system permease protein
MQKWQLRSELFGKSWLWGGISLLAIVVYGMSSGVRSEIIILFYVYALLGLGIYMPLALTNQVSLAYSAYFGIGAYSYAVCSSAGRFEPAVGILIGVVLSGILAAFVGLATSRLSSYFLSVSTMLVAVVFERFLIQATSVTGGPTGLGFSKILFGMAVSRVHILIGGALIVWLIAVGLTNLGRSSPGKGLLLLSRSAAAAESVGLETRRVRIVSLCVGACIASLGGSVLALSSGFVIPESYNLMVGFMVIFIPLIGGTVSPWGSLIGAAIVCYVLQVAHMFGPSQLLFALTTLAVVLLVPGGIIGGFQTLVKKFSSVRRSPVGEKDRGEDLVEEVSPLPKNMHHFEIAELPMGKVLLEVNGICKSFAGLQALSEVSFEVRRGEIVGIVGPNGAGKSTLVDIITGVQEADFGYIMLDGSRLTEGPACRAHLGMSRTFQHPLLAQSLTVLENIRLGHFRNGAPRNWVGLFAWFLGNMILSGRQYPGETVNGDPTLEREFALLSRSPHTIAADVSYGTEKLSETVRALVSLPTLILMDEPFAGVDMSSIDAVGRILRYLRSSGLGAIIVDHNVDVLRDICDRLVVLNYGQVIAEGAPREVLQDPAVRKAYFGDE